MRRRRKARTMKAKPRQLHLPGLDAPARSPMTDARAKPRKGVEPCFLSRWTPRHVWTLHRVPGRLDGPPLAVRRRVLDDEMDFLHVETPYGDMGVDGQDLGAVEHAGHARGIGSPRYDDDRAPNAAGFYGIDLALDVYDHSPTAAERAAWLERRKVEQSLMKAPPARVWIGVPGASGGSDRAVRCDVEWGARDRHKGEVFAPGVQRDRPVWTVYKPGPTIDIRDLAMGPIVFRDGEVRRVWLRKPKAGELAAAGAERDEHDRESEKNSQAAEAFFASFRQARPAAADEIRARAERAAWGRFLLDNIEACRAKLATEEQKAREASERGDRGAAVAAEGMAGFYREHLNRWLKDEEAIARARRYVAEATAPPAAIDPGLRGLAELGLGPDATAEEVRAVFRERAKNGHADKGGQADMGALRQAKDVALAYVERRDAASSPDAL